MIQESFFWVYLQNKLKSLEEIVKTFFFFLETKCHSVVQARLELSAIFLPQPLSAKITDMHHHTQQYDLYTYVYENKNHKSQEVESTCMSIHKWLDKQNVVYSYNISFNLNQDKSCHVVWYGESQYTK